MSCVCQTVRVGTHKTLLWTQQLTGTTHEISVTEDTSVLGGFPLFSVSCQSQGNYDQ